MITIFGFIKKIRAKKYTSDISAYISQNYKPPVRDTGKRHCLSKTSKTKTTDTESVPSDQGIRYSDRDSHHSTGDGAKYSREMTPSSEQGKTTSAGGNIRYSLKKKPQNEDSYDAAEVARLLRNYSNADNFSEMLDVLEKNVNQTFVDRLLYYISQKGVKDSDIYKAAGVDKRLFSKMVSNRLYKPSKDTAISLAMALELPLEEANDMLSRAGYTLSHSNKRDIIVEYFFRERIYNLIDVNDVLYSMGQKIIGRT